MPDVSSNQPADVRLWVSLDVHKLSIVAAILPPGSSLNAVKATGCHCRPFQSAAGACSIEVSV